MDMQCLIIYMTVMLIMMISASSTGADDPPHFWPANIIGSTSAKAGNDVLLKCNTFGRGVSNSEIHMYLCKDGGGVMMEPLVNKDEYTFTLKRVTVLDSGNYSCVYSIEKYPARNVTASGKNSVHVQVTGDVPEIPVRSFLIPLGVLLLIMIFLFGAYHNRARIHNKFFQTQEESEQDSTEPCQEQEKKTLNRIDDTYFYCE